MATHPYLESSDNRSPWGLALGFIIWFSHAHCLGPRCFDELQPNNGLWPNNGLCRYTVPSNCCVIFVAINYPISLVSPLVSPFQPMLGTFQQSQLRIEISAPASVIRDAIVCPPEFSQWMWPQRVSAGLPNPLTDGLKFTSWIGPVAIQHEVISVTSQELQMLLSQGIDGVHQWCWGEGWLQSSIEGITLLPLNLGQTLSLLRLRQFLERRVQQTAAAPR